MQGERFPVLRPSLQEGAKHPTCDRASHIFGMSRLASAASLVLAGCSSTRLPGIGPADESARVAALGRWLGALGVYPGYGG